MNLLNELLDRCIAGDCDTQTACKLLGIRHESVRELIRQRRVADLAHRRLVGGFYACFPDCDPRLARRYEMPGRESDSMYREEKPAPCRTYTAEEAASLPPSQSRILNGDSERAFVCNNTNRQVREFMTATRRLPPEPEPELELSGPEFEFAA